MGAVMISRRRPLPAFRIPWRWDLYRVLVAVLSIDASAYRGEARARELYRQAQDIAEKTGEAVSDLVWALATLEAALVAAEPPAEEEAPRHRPRSKSRDYLNRAVPNLFTELPNF